MSEYVGNELDLFQSAVNWKKYWASQIRPYLGKRVLEVGAGIAANVPFLMSPAQRQWLCLEPDPQLGERIKSRMADGELPANCYAETGTIDALPAESQFDTVLYIDVMEHIEADTVEFKKAANRLAVGGHLVILSPAHQVLFSPFDAAIGHHRRYSRSALRNLAEAGELQQVKIFYLDSIGLVASLANRLLLRSEMPSPRQIMFWDRVMVPLSRVIDPLLLHALGKTVIGIWRKP